MTDAVKPTLYECMETGVITEIEYIFPAQFSVAKKYEILYAEELPRFRTNPLLIYGVPFFDTPKYRYLGLGRDGLSVYAPKAKFLTPAKRKLVRRIEESFISGEEFFLQSKDDAAAFLSIFRDAKKYELIWHRISGSSDTPPFGWRLLGFDISYCPDYWGGRFSMICDCMFICRWHGCDPEGILFREDFERLNENGLFSSHADAYKYMFKYLAEDWTERGDFGIFEIYGE
ncbi:MAG: hypothetical protein IJU78_00365 [Clostridia bacterium]|nr:hypothetical protein [Clostridia bacterium]